MNTPMNRFCVNCGHELKEGNRFCPKCGTESGPLVPSSSPTEFEVVSEIPSDSKRELSTRKKIVRIILCALAAAVGTLVVLLIVIAILFGSSESPSNPARHAWSRAAIANTNGDYEKVVKEYTEAINLDPQYVRVMITGMNLSSYYLRGEAYYNLGQYQRAIKDFDDAFRLGPQCHSVVCTALIYSYRGFSYYELGQYERAIKDFDEAIRLTPQGAPAYINLLLRRGLAYQSLGMTKEAERDFAKAKELGYNPLDYTAPRGRGVRGGRLAARSPMGD